MKNKLSKQLILITGISFILIIISFGIVLPKLLTPAYEKNVYNYLKQPQRFISEETVLVPKEDYYDDIAYIYINNNYGVRISENYSDLIDTEPTNIINELEDTSGKIKIDGKTYYYYLSLKGMHTKIITITDDAYLSVIKKDVLNAVLPITVVTFLITILILFLWSKKLVDKIELLKQKIKNINNKKYNHSLKIITKDELHELESSIEETRLELLDNEKYKSEMFQNISHDLKTPISVIKSYIEAIEDKVETKEKGLSVIKEQTDKLKEKVESLLYLNKLEYYKENNFKDFKNINISKIINKSVEKFKIQNKKINWRLSLDESRLTGTKEMWEIVIDNILSNFLRYAKKEIKITLEDNKLTLYNDGPNIERSIMDDIFEPYKKGIKGRFGLGLSIVKKTIELFGYKIHIRNEEKGAKFIIK